MSKRKVTLFVSYARANRVLASKFLEKFSDSVGPARNYKYSFWRDGNILVGEGWHEEIQRAIEESEMGLLLISPAFLASQYIEEKELPKFVGRRAKPVIPVMLQPVDLDLHDLKGLKHRQIFRLDRTGFRNPKSFAECTGQQRDDFALGLFRQVESRLAKLYGRKR